MEAAIDERSNWGLGERGRERFCNGMMRSGVGGGGTCGRRREGVARARCGACIVSCWGVLGSVTDDDGLIRGDEGV